MHAYGMEFRHGLFLAPLSGYTDWPLRMLCREFGAELCYTEMISAAGLVRNSKNSRSMLVRPPGDSPLVAQIATNSPEDAARAARLLQDAGFDGIDINMGCPVKKVASKGGGVALMTDTDLALRITRAVIDAVSIPVSVKMRAGWDVTRLNAAELAESLEFAGITAVILHPRTRGDMYRGTPRWEVFSEVKERVRIPVVASGDIRTPDDIGFLQGLGADGFMIGRGAIGRPWIFRELAGGQTPAPLERRDIMLRHLDWLCSCHGTRTGVLHMRKFITGYVRGMRGAAHFRQEACLLDSPSHVRDRINEFFDQAEQA
ncbi:MAG TPA: tRNA dihydrouridine synthase DusB [Deltaproteobacteria bacterium]|nr:tRNA dihydrouridine synthase DusB [Deltaproteobacteria bacterium]HQI81455.1 tRNA dihydrouridine synthase DusB [Deltaproteobacteria bacterium]